jgi:hypothetical protein
LERVHSTPLNEQQLNHSLTHENGDSGQIQINPQESIAIAQLKNALTEAIEHSNILKIFFDRICRGSNL